MSQVETHDLQGDVTAVLRSPEFTDAVAGALVRALVTHADAEAGPDAKLRSVLPLLKEYTEKLKVLRPNAALAPEHARNRAFLLAAKRLAQFVSQRLESTTDSFLIIELQLRLAEYETALSIAEARR